MTPRTRKLGIVALVLIASILVSVTSRRDVSLVFGGFQTNRLMGPKEDHVLGLILLTNASGKLVPYTQFNQMPDHVCVYQIGGRWTELEGLCCPRHKVWLGASRIEDRALHPRQGIAFQVVLERTNIPCKVQFNIQPGSTNLRQRVLPSWLVKRVPWFKNPEVVETSVFEYRE